LAGDIRGVHIDRDYVVPFNECYKLHGTLGSGVIPFSSSLSTMA